MILVLMTKINIIKTIKILSTIEDKDFLGQKYQKRVFY